MGKTKKIISIDNFDENATVVKLTSPRSVEACKRQGIMPSELSKVTMDQINNEVKESTKESGSVVPPKIPGHVNNKTDQTFNRLVQMRYNFYDQKRQKLIESIKIERMRIAQEEQAGIWVNPQNDNYIEDPDQFLSPGMGNDYMAESQKSRGGRSRRATSGNRSQGSNYSPAGGKGKSSMIEKEKMQLEKIKQKQQKEIESMMEAERRQEEIRERNRLKELKEHERERKREAELIVKRQQQDIKKQQDELRRRDAAQREEMQQRQVMQKAQAKEEGMRQKQAYEESTRLEEAKRNDLMRKEKQMQLEIETNAKMEQQARELAKRQDEMKKRDEERTAYLEDQNRMRNETNAEKRRIQEIKIAEARSREEQLLQQQRHQFQEKEVKAERQREEFEYRRNQQKLNQQHQAQAKAQQIEQVKIQNDMMQEQKKQTFLRQQELANDRLRQLDMEKDRQAVVEKQQEEEKNQYRRDVQIKMQINEQQRKAQIEYNRQQMDQKVARTIEDKSNQYLLKKEGNKLERIERQRTVERIQRQQEYHKEQVLKKIMQDNTRSVNLKTEKEQLMETRKVMKKEALIQKKNINEAFDKMKTKGKMDSQTLEKLGLNNLGSESKSRVASHSPMQIRNNRNLPGHISGQHKTMDDYNGAAGAGSVYAKSNHPIQKFDTNQATHSQRNNSKLMRGSLQVNRSNANRSTQSKKKYNAVQSKQDMDNLRKKFNDELLQILEEEQRKENARESQIQAISNPQEAGEMERKFGIERARASHKIIEISNQHEQIILKEMKRLGLV